MKNTNFGDYLKNLRIEKGLTLRKCAYDLSTDPSGWSKMERGVSPAPKDTSLVAKWGAFFGLAGAALDEFLDLASLSRSEIPMDMARDGTVIAALPAFFRAVRGHELVGDRLTAFMEDLRAIHSPDPEPR